MVTNTIFSLSPSTTRLLVSFCPKIITVKFVLQQIINGVHGSFPGKKVACAEQDIKRTMLVIHRLDLGAQVVQVAVC
jgi:hypothetical protein